MDIEYFFCLTSIPGSKDPLNKHCVNCNGDTSVDNAPLPGIPGFSGCPAGWQILAKFPTACTSSNPSSNISTLFG